MGLSSEQHDSSKIYDMIVLGAGPAGLTAAIYGCRAGMDVLVVEHMMPGGEITATEQMDNSPGFPEGVGGIEFGQLLEKHAKRFGAELISSSIKDAEAEGEQKKVITGSGEFWGRTLVVSTGTAPSLLGVPGEDKLSGRGISFCATCDGPFFKNKTVAVIGGGDSAVEEALYLTRFAEKVVLVHRRDKLRAVQVLQEKVINHPKVEIIWDSVVREFAGENKLEKLLLENVKDGTISEIPVDGAFLYVGRIPNTGFIDGVEKDPRGYIITNEEMETGLPGVYAAGDIRRKFLRQVLTAAADGAIAATMALKYLDDLA